MVVFWIGFTAYRTRLVVELRCAEAFAVAHDIATAGRFYRPHNRDFDACDRSSYSKAPSDGDNLGAWPAFPKGYLGN